jgi:hypothetical protein
VSSPPVKSWPTAPRARTARTLRSAQVSAGPMPSKKSAYGKMYANFDDRLQGINNGKRNAHNALKSANAVHNQFRHFEDSEACACPAPALRCGDA